MPVRSAMGSVKTSTFGSSESAKSKTIPGGTFAPISNSPKRPACCVKRMAVRRSRESSR
jgi:hypothetical protein